MLGGKMKELSMLPNETFAGIDVIFTDIDDTLTTDGKLTSTAYVAMERLQEAGILVVPVTGRCAGWCDHIARMWPVSAVVGENGAFYFRYDHDTKVMHREFCQSGTERYENHARLQSIGKEILSTVHGTALASDQEYRLTDLAIDFAEDVPRLPSQKIHQIVAIAEQAGLVAKISSIHVNCWIGDHSKLSTSLMMLDQVFDIKGARTQENVVFVGDSPNDATMFGYFEKSVGVANVLEYLTDLQETPNYITTKKCGAGFTELADVLLAAQRTKSQ
jgi:HAD superfamily hydrolase (TIGR01484 family)